MEQRATARVLRPDDNIAAELARVPALVWFLLAVCAILAADLADGVLFLGDVDDRMRAFQIRDLLADGAWYDRTLPFIAMPEAYVSPWSRLVDLPYVAITWILTPLAGAQAGLLVATWLWPLLLAVAFSACALSVIRALCPASPPLTHLIGTAIAMTYALWEFTPGRIDHHNVQLVLMAAMLAGLMSARVWRGGALAGASAVLSVAVGLECLPFIAIAFGVRGFAALMGDREAQGQMIAAAAAILFVTPLSALVLIGPGGMSRTACDAYSAPWIAALMGAAPLLAMFAVPQLRKLPTPYRFLVAGGGALALVVTLAGAFPECLDGPYSMIDATARSFWLDRVAQEQSALAFVAERRIGLVVMLGLCGFILVATAGQALLRIRAGDGKFVMIWLVAAAALVLTLLQIRYIRFAPAFAPLLLPWLLGAISTTPSAVAPLRLAGAAIVPGGLAIALLLSIPQRDRQFDAIDLMTWDECKGADVSVLAAFEAGRIIAPPGLSFTIAEGAVAGRHAHTVSSLSFHRAAPGISRVATAFTANDAAARRAAMAPFDYLAICQRNTRIDLAAAPLYAALMAGQDWPGLQHIAGPSEAGLKLFAIDHSLLH